MWVGIVVSHFYTIRNEDTYLVLSSNISLTVSLPDEELIHLRNYVAQVFPMFLFLMYLQDHSSRKSQHLRMVE